MERKIEVEKAKELLRCERLIEEYVKRGVRVKKTLDQWKVCFSLGWGHGRNRISDFILF